MSVKFRMLRTNIIIVFSMQCLTLVSCFIVFWIGVLPYAGARVMENLGAIASRYLLTGIIIVVVVTVIGAALLWTNSVRSFIWPLQNLKRAAALIRDGNLDNELVVKGDDEFAEVCRSFEEMRIRLKNSMLEKEIAEQERSIMMESICHDLKTPVTSILGYTEGLLDGVANTDEKRLDYIRIIKKKALMMQQLTLDLTLLSQLESNRLELTTKIIDVGTFAAGIVSDYALEYDGMQTTFDIEEDLNCRIDRERFARVLLNLLENSVKYKKPGQTAPSIHLAAAYADGNALLTLTDDGIGIQGKDMPHVYKRFYRADASRGIIKGSGLGLSIVWQIVNLHGGKTWMRTPKDGGLTVCILLPLNQTMGEDAA